MTKKLTFARTGKTVPITKLHPGVEFNPAHIASSYNEVVEITDEYPTPPKGDDSQFDMVEAPDSDIEVKYE